MKMDYLVKGLTPCIQQVQNESKNKRDSFGKGKNKHLKSQETVENH